MLFWKNFPTKKKNVHACDMHEIVYMTYNVQMHSIRSFAWKNIANYLNKFISEKNSTNYNMLNEFNYTLL